MTSRTQERVYIQHDGKIRTTMNADDTTGKGTETATQKTAETIMTVGDTLTTMSGGVDILEKLFKLFWRQDKIGVKSEKCQSEINVDELKYDRFVEKQRCNKDSEIPIHEFKEYVENLQKEFDLSDAAKSELLKGLDQEEKKVRDGSFEFEQGKGEIRLLRSLTMKRNEKMDIAYAIYTLSFTLEKKESEDWYFEFLFWVVPVGWKYKKIAQNLSEKKKK